MSAIIGNAPYINLSTGQKYGIKVVNELVLPIALQNESEVRELEREVRVLFKKVNVGTDYISARPGSVWNTDTSGGEDVKIKAGNSIVISAGYLTSIYTSKRTQIGVDKILRNTSLGKKLKEYWITEEKISPEDAQKRLEQITPLATLNLKQ